MFIGYQRRRTGYQKRELAPYASINRRGEIVLNASVWEMIGRINYTQLFYDAESRRIAIGWTKPVDHSLQTFFVRRHGRGGRSRIIRAGRFLKQFGINIIETIVFRDLKVEPGQMLVLDLTHDVARWENCRSE